MAKVTVRRSGKITLDMGALRRLIPLIVGWVVRRTAGGRDLHERPFRGYSPRYRERLARMGETSLVDLRVTGGLLNSVRHLRTEANGKDRVTMFFGPGTGTSPQVAPPPLRGKRRARRTGRRGPPHNLVGAWLHYGHGKMPPRPWLGLGKEGDGMVRRALERLAIFRSR